jgi:hypothetical protein
MPIGKLLWTSISPPASNSAVSALPVHGLCSPPQVELTAAATRNDPARVAGFSFVSVSKSAPCSRCQNAQPLRSKTERYLAFSSPY